MPEPARKGATYDDLYKIPENMTGEIIDGELFLSPRPSRKHVRAASSLGYVIGPAYDLGALGGPGGWIILEEPEVAFGENILVPDLAGWREARFPEEEEYNWIPVAPDWVCEVLSPGSFRNDKIVKMPLYARHGVPHLWLVDPLNKTLEVFRLKSGAWTITGTFSDADLVRAESFQEIEIDLSTLWLESRLKRPPQGKPL